MAAIRAKNSYFAAQYQRLRPRLGHGRAPGAVQHSMLTVIWHMLSTGETYRDLGGDYYRRATPNGRRAASSPSSKRSATPSPSRSQPPEVAPPVFPSASAFALPMTPASASEQERRCGRSVLGVPIPHPPDRGYDEHQARATLEGLIGSVVRGIRIITLDELCTSDDGRDIKADLAIELRLNQGGDETSALFHWGVNFFVEQLCVWRQPLTTVWPVHADAPSFELSRTWPGWPRGRLTSVEAFKLRPSEVGVNRAELHFGRAGLRIRTGGLSGDEVDSLLLSPLR